MATIKKSTKTPAVAPVTASPADARVASANAARAAKDTALGKDTFRFVKPYTKNTPQCKVIVNVLQADLEAFKADPKNKGKKYPGISRNDLVAKLKGVLVTRQPEGRILSYYQKDLANDGAISIDKSAVGSTTPVATPAPAAEAPAETTEEAEVTEETPAPAPSEAS